MALAFISDSLAFEQSLLALCDLSRIDAIRELDPVIERFVLPLDARDPRKAIRFESLSACRHFDANHLVLDCSRHDLPPRRPMEFAIEQLILSGSHPAWRKAVARLGAHPRFDGSLQRPLLLSLSDGDRRAPPTPIFASVFLAQLAARGEPTLAELSRQLEMRMSESARSAARAWAAPAPGAASVRAWVGACSPIALRGS